MEEDYQKDSKKVTLFFLPNPAPFNRQNYQKQKEPGTSDQPLFRLRNKFRKIPALVTYYLTKFDDVIYQESLLHGKIHIHQNLTEQLKYWQVWQLYS